jgi:hypothetical protein
VSPRRLEQGRTAGGARPRAGSSAGTAAERVPLLARYTWRHLWMKNTYIIPD